MATLVPVDDLLLGIDIGTGSTKGVLARADGEIVGTASRAHRMSLPRPGWAEMDAEAVWWVGRRRDLPRAPAAGPRRDHRRGLRLGSGAEPA